jgi:hypothetical protein
MSIKQKQNLKKKLKRDYVKRRNARKREKRRDLEELQVFLIKNCFELISFKKPVIEFRLKQIYFKK